MSKCKRSPNRIPLRMAFQTAGAQCLQPCALADVARVEMNTRSKALGSNSFKASSQPLRSSALARVIKATQLLPILVLLPPAPSSWW
eukprot:5624753-Amphidinium_carterae.1